MSAYHQSIHTQSYDTQSHPPPRVSSPRLCLFGPILPLGPVPRLQQHLPNLLNQLPNLPKRNLLHFLPSQQLPSGCHWICFLQALLNRSAGLLHLFEQSRLQDLPDRICAWSQQQLLQLRHQDIQLFDLLNRRIDLPTVQLPLHPHWK